MTAAQEFRRALQHRNEQEQELTNMRARLGPLEQEVRLRKNAVRQTQEEVDALNGSGLKNLFLELTGKKEAILVKQKREAAAARSEQEAASLRLEALKRTIKDLEQDLCDLSVWEEPCLALTSQPDAAVIREQIDRIRRTAALYDRLQQQYPPLLRLLEDTEAIYVRGDVRADLSGGRYDNRLHSMREQSVPCQAMLTEFLTTLTSYSALSGAALQDTQPGSWIDDSNYLTSYAIDAKELYDRFDDVVCWLRRLSHIHGSREPQRLERTRLIRQDLRRTLLKALDQLPE